MSEADRRPWRVDESDASRIRSSCERKTVADTYGRDGVAEANAALIVRAVNHFDELVTALRSSHEALELVIDYHGSEHDDDCDCSQADYNKTLNDGHEIARELLARIDAKGWGE